jgi:hypothetical protein
VTRPALDVAASSGFESTPGQDDYDDIGLVEYAFVDFADVREAFHRAREVFLTEADAEVVATIEIAAPPEFVWGVTKDMQRAPEMFPTLVEAKSLTGAVEQAGSVHTCLHGDGMHVVHYRVAYDEANFRATDRLTGVPFVGRMLQTWEARASRTGTRFSFYYSTRPEIPISDEEVSRVVHQTIRDHAERDVEGLKAFCEREYAAR